MEKFKWPDGFKSAVAFSFDVDGCAEQQLYEGNILGHNSVGDYGPKVGVPRILGLLDKYNLKAIFFTTGWVAERFPERIKEIHDRGHEVGAHGYLHEDFGQLSESEEREIHDKSTRIITDVTGTRPRAFRAPTSLLDPTRTLKMLVDRGYDCDSCSTKDYFPSRVRLGGEEIDMVEIPFSWVLDDFPYFWGGYEDKPEPAFMPISAPKDVLEYWVAEFYGVHKIGGFFGHLNHPRVIGRISRLRVLEKLICHIKATPDVWITDYRGIVNWVLRMQKGGK